MDRDWIAQVRRFERTLELVRREQATGQGGLVEHDLRDVLRLTPNEQASYRQLIREASTPHCDAGEDDLPFLRADEERLLFLSCDYTVWAELPFVLRSLLRQAFLELRALRTLPLGDDRPFAYASKARIESSPQATR